MRSEGGAIARPVSSPVPVSGLCADGDCFRTVLALSVPTLVLLAASSDRLERIGDVPMRGSEIPAVLPGAEAWSYTAADSSQGRAPGALVLHGFTGNPSSVRTLAQAFAAEGFHVELPRLPGHGTTIEDMLTTGWGDWSAATEDAYERLAGRAGAIVVAGLSMGAELTLWLALRHPQVVGIVCINPATGALVGVAAATASMATRTVKNTATATAESAAGSAPSAEAS